MADFCRAWIRLVCNDGLAQASLESDHTEESQDLITQTTGFVQRSPRLQKLIEKGALEQSSGIRRAAGRACAFGSLRSVRSAVA